jgi:hypothetical protein
LISNASRHATRTHPSSAATAPVFSIPNGHVARSLVNQLNSSATTARWPVVRHNGPYAEGKEHLGGFVIIKVPDLDAALEWARKQAEAVRLLPVEVRPFQGAAED